MDNVQEVQDSTSEDLQPEWSERSLINNAVLHRVEGGKIVTVRFRTSEGNASDESTQSMMDKTELSNRTMIIEVLKNGLKRDGVMEIRENQSENHQLPGTSDKHNETGMGMIPILMDEDSMNIKGINLPAVSSTGENYILGFIEQKDVRGGPSVASSNHYLRTGSSSISNAHILCTMRNGRYSAVSVSPEKPMSIRCNSGNHKVFEKSNTHGLLTIPENTSIGHLPSTQDVNTQDMNNNFSSNTGSSNSDHITVNHCGLVHKIPKPVEGRVGADKEKHSDNVYNHVTAMNACTEPASSSGLNASQEPSTSQEVTMATDNYFEMQTSRMPQEEEQDDQWPGDQHETTKVSISVVGFEENTTSEAEAKSEETEKNETSNEVRKVVKEVNIANINEPNLPQRESYMDKEQNSKVEDDANTLEENFLTVESMDSVSESERNIGFEKSSTKSTVTNSETLQEEDKDGNPASDLSNIEIVDDDDILPSSPVGFDCFYGSPDRSSSTLLPVRQCITARSLTSPADKRITEDETEDSEHPDTSCDDTDPSWLSYNNDTSVQSEPINRKSKKRRKNIKLRSKSKRAKLTASENIFEKMEECNRDDPHVIDGGDGSLKIAEKTSDENSDNEALESEKDPEGIVDCREHSSAVDDQVEPDEESSECESGNEKVESHDQGSLKEKEQSDDGFSSPEESRASSPTRKTQSQEGTEESFAKEEVISHKSPLKKNNKNLWITGLSSKTSAMDLKAIFVRYGKVVTAKVMSRKSDSKCYGLIRMSKSEDVRKCLLHLNNTSVNGDKIQVMLAPAKLSTQKKSKREDGKPHQSKHKERRRRSKSPNKPSNGKKVRVQRSRSRSRSRTRNRPNRRLATFPTEGSDTQMFEQWFKFLEGREISAEKEQLKREWNRLEREKMRLAREWSLLEERKRADLEEIEQAKWRMKSFHEMARREVEERQKEMRRIYNSTVNVTRHQMQKSISDGKDIVCPKREVRYTHRRSMQSEDVYSQPWQSGKPTSFKQMKEETQISRDPRDSSAPSSASNHDHSSKEKAGFWDWYKQAVTP